MSEDIYFPNDLFHGTDKKVLSYSQEKRDGIKTLCINIAEYFYQRFLEDGMSVLSISQYKEKRSAVIKDDWINFLRSFQQYDSHRRGSEYYQYDCFYLTTSKDRAKRYARLSFIYGEIGSIADCLYRSAKKIWGIRDLSDSSESIHQMITTFEAIRSKVPEPVILSFGKIPKMYLLRENGEHIDWPTMERYYTSRDLETSFRCTMKMQELTYSVIQLT